ncbi:hypothetical protein PV416_11710 [Streptomyces ipomoeae]|uniref:Membrane-bound hydrophilic protein n=1 Tax=Streptomyces ipomoeae 91-03 TaxID=698759 RepID=L1L0P9_9ACTN|nr:hypothetical protein [Streptomyces ipomoeae]EKX66354.1 hypothetical protein STRIP9103_06828 [Streptomyces ipomoeae 91-03]MDX2694299.1 hypothetical protein [Streptomyces ipomoeae]MDX2821745.1 hypothetical protein [Streptomyces ipomoeae]MDX2840234.1 hypothetical protein [Streptomyces ipomoeae]MDX2874381.1 hypothetical protein [Streptomyces ipomoeae]
MPADEVTHGTSVGESRARSGPRHAAPKKPLLTRLKMPAGKAIALAAMPTAVLMGTGFTPTLARAEDPASQSLTADEYKDCVAALEADEDGEDTSASPSPTPSASASESADTSDDSAKDEDTTGSDTGSDSSDDSASGDTSGGGSSSSDSGSDDKDTADDSTTTEKTATDTGTTTPSPSASEDSGGNVLEDIGDALGDLFTGDESESTSTATPSATPSPSASDDTSGSSGSSGSSGDTAADAGKDAQDTADDSADKVEDAAKDITDGTEDAADDTAADATTTPSPSPSDEVSAEDCPAATDDESGVEKGIPPLPNDPWYLNASSLLLKGASYKGIVKVKTADGTVKEVLKYVISDGTDIGDLHQTVEDKQAGVTYHAQAGKGTTSTIRDGATVMYTESISGNLLGLIPVTFDPKHPPPLDIPLIYFTNAKVVQAGQFGGTLTVPGLHQYTTD